MREIKFRAWDKKDREIIYNQYIDEWRGPFGDSGYIVLFLNFDGSISGFIPDDGGKNGLHEHDADELDKDRFIIMQYTGLKDKNGVEIYEGDIVKHSCGAYGVITWLNDGMQFGITQGWCHPVYGNPPPNESEIIGNIWENPELLEL